MDRQTLRDWVIRYNERGLSRAVGPSKRGGAAAKRSVEEEAVLAGWVRQNPDLADAVSCTGGCAICVSGSWRASSS